MSSLAPVTRPKLIAGLERTFAGLEPTVGFRLLGPEYLPRDLPYATAVSLTPPVPGARS
jgi:hypothetical protein